jgi:hypothetical protein
MKKNVMFLSMKSALSCIWYSLSNPLESSTRISNMLITLEGSVNGSTEEMTSPTRQRPKISASCIKYFMDAIPYPIGRYSGKRCLAGMRITMDTVINHILTTQECAKFSIEQIGDEDLNLSLKATTLAPSGMNQEPWHFTAIQDPETLRELDEKAAGPGESFFYHAPTLILVSIAIGSTTILSSVYNPLPAVYPRGTR